MAYELVTLIVLSAAVILKHVADRVVVRLRDCEPKIERQDPGVTILKEPRQLDILFETWLERGYVVADGIYSKLISKKKQGGIDVFTVQKDFLNDEKSYVVKRGNQFSHGDTIKRAIEDLRYKLSDRDTERFKKWKPDTKISVDDAIQAYRAITGACEFGVKSFVEKTKVPKSLTVKKVIELTEGAYGNQQFAGFFSVVSK